MSYYGGYSNRNNSSAWPRDIKPFERQMDRSQNISPMQNYGFNPGYHNQGPNSSRPLLPSPSDGQGMHYQQQRQSNMNYHNGPRENAYSMPMPMEPDPNIGFHDNWNSFPENGNNMLGPNEMHPWADMRNGQDQHFGISQQGPNSMQRWSNRNGQDREFGNSQRIFTPKMNRPSSLMGNRNQTSFQSKHVTQRFTKGFDKTASPLLNRTQNYKGKYQSPSNITNSTRRIVKKPLNKNVSKNEVPPRGSFCSICNLSFSTIDAKLAHLKTSDHNRQKQLRQNKLTKKGNQGTKKIITPKVDKSVKTYCTICQLKFTGTSIAHMASEEHKNKKALNRPYCTHCQKFLRSPARFVKHCGTIAHKKNVAMNKKSEGDDAGENLIDDEFFTLDAIGIYDSDQEELSHGEEEEASQQSKQRKVTSVEKITISLPTDSIGQDLSNNVVDSEKGKKDVGEIPVVSISQKDGVEVKSVNLKPATAKVLKRVNNKSKPLAKKPKLVGKKKPVPVDKKKPMTAANKKPKLADNKETKPVDTEEPKPMDDGEPKPVDSMESKLVDNMGSKSVNNKEFNSVDNKKSNVVEDKPKEVENEPKRVDSESKPEEREQPTDKEVVIKTENVDSSEEFVGQSYIIAISGYYCKLCEVFIKDEVQAKNKHCESEEHQNNYKDVGGDTS